MNNTQLYLILLILVSLGSLSALELAITDPGRAMYVQANPQESWLVTTDGYQSKIYDSNLELLETFTLPQADVSIIGAGYDFDEDDNIEVLYSWYDTSNYQTHVFLRDISTGQYELSYSTGCYYAFTLYSNSERIVIINEYDGSEYQQCRIYRSGVAQSASSTSTFPAGNISDIKPYPSPFSNGMSLGFTLKEDMPVSIAVYNIKGQKLRTLDESFNLQGGKHVVFWDGCDDQGSKLPTGEYFFTVSSDNEIEVKKVLHLK
ncbi:MAG: hypothetical protein K9M99_08135 [Candidatus Cloacimonetes bacterium]|nr:hypothetical protein [Candidatus Cloacimonadota bacterium]